MNLLLQHQWTGNVRELKNYVQRAIALSDPNESQLETQFLIPAHLSSQLDTRPESHDLSGRMYSESPNAEESPLIGVQFSTDQDFKSAKSKLIQEFELNYWRTLMERHQFNISAAARVAGIHRKSAEYIIKKLGLKS